MDEPVSDDQQLALALRLLDDDEAALEDILRRFGPAIKCVLLNQFMGVLNEQDIEDVLSIALRKLWDARNSYDDRRGTLRAWFFRIAKNTAKDVLKHGWMKTRHLETDMGSELALTEAVEASALDDTATEKSQRKKISKEKKDLNEILQMLPEAQRTIVLADAASEADIASSAWLAEKLQIPVVTVRVYRKRAMDKIKTELRKRGYQLLQTMQDAGKGQNGL